MWTFSAALFLVGLHLVAIGLTAATGSFDPLHHSGPASPYFDAPDQFGIGVEIPVGCSVDQAAYIVRHGARYPEPDSFTGWQTLFEDLQNNSYTASGTLAFLPSWSLPVDVADESHEPLFLTSTGALESFVLGVQLRQKYGLTTPGDNFTVWAAAEQRVLDTATFFMRGYLSQGNYMSDSSLNRGTVVSLPDSTNFTYADSLTPSSSCPLYASGSNGTDQSNVFRATYQSGIADRINSNFLTGNLTLSTTNIGVMQDLCGFGNVINGEKRFCEIFNETEWLDYEYANDLNYYYGAGPGNPFAAATGFPWVKAVTDLFALGPNRTTSNGTIVPPSLLMGFTHDNNLPPVIAALGLWNTSSIPGVYPLPNTQIAPNRTFRSSDLVSFRGYVALERLSCSEGAAANSSVEHTAFDFGGVAVHTGPEVQNGTFVRVRVNNAPVPIPQCASGPGSTCSLDDFVSYVNVHRALASGDFVQTCGLQNVSNATSELMFFTNTILNSETFLLPVDGLIGS